MTVAVLASGAAIAPADMDIDAADRPAISAAADPSARARP